MCQTTLKYITIELQSILHALNFQPELPETIDWRSRIQNPGFKPNGEGYSKARDTASAILE